jgi:hypothetical protein
MINIAMNLKIIGLLKEVEKNYLSTYVRRGHDKREIKAARPQIF